MQITFDISPETRDKIETFARQEGIPTAALLEKMVSQYNPKIRPENIAFINLLQSWREEDETDDEDELALRDAENAELMKNLQQNRIKLSAPATPPGIRRLSF